MTISTTTNKVNQAGDGIQTVFPYRFLVLDETHMKVLVDEVELSSGWSMDGIGDPNGGYVTIDTAPADGSIVTLYRDVPLTQLTDYTEAAFQSDTHEVSLDKITMILQQLQEQLLRSINLPVSDDGTTAIIFPSYDPGKLIGWCDATKALCNIDPPECPAAYVDPYHQMFGRISSAGAVVKSGGEGFTVNVLGSGNHQIVFDTPITDVYAVVVSIAEGAQPGWGSTVFVTDESTTSFTVETKDDETGASTSRDWSFHLVYETP